MDAWNHHSFTKRRVHRILLLSKREKRAVAARESIIAQGSGTKRDCGKKEIRQRNKEAELREALFRRISFFHKLPSLHTDDKQDESAANSKIVVTNTEWAEVISVVNDAFDNFVVRLQQAYPSLGEKEKSASAASSKSMSIYRIYQTSTVSAKQLSPNENIESKPTSWESLMKT